MKKIVGLFSMLCLIAFVVMSSAAMPDPPTGGTGCSTDANGQCYCCALGGCSGVCCWRCAADGSDPVPIDPQEAEKLGLVEQLKAEAQGW